MEKQIGDLLDEYSREIKEGIKESTEKIAKGGADELKKISPKRKGKYAKSWEAEQQGNTYVIRNKDHYRLTHLLEFGHATRSGGRTRAFPHIKNVEEKIKKDYQDEIERLIK